MTNLICIIKLGALGDVVRTTPILKGIKEKYPDSKITWITKKQSKAILEKNPLISNLVLLPIQQTLPDFDVLYSLDIEDEALQLANQINSKEKFGYYGYQGFPASFNVEAEYYLNTVFDDSLKKSNMKTYQEMIFKTCKLNWHNQEISVFLSEESERNINSFLTQNNLKGEKIIGFNIGSSDRWPSKAWHKDKILEFLIYTSSKGYKVLLLGGPQERESMELITKEADTKGIKIYSKNTSDSLSDFFSLVNACSIVVSADSMAMHIALAFKKKTIALFFVTSPQEIEGYGNLTKVISPKLLDFFPNKSDIYSEDLTKSISVNEVIQYI